MSGENNSGELRGGCVGGWFFGLSQFFATENFFDGCVAVNESMAGFVVDAFGADVGGGGGDDFLQIPREEIWIG